jgi:diacylglycerol kinase (ATP)
MITEKFYPARKFSWKERGKSFVFAWAGIITFLRSEHNARLHLLATVATVALSASIGVSKAEAIVLILCMALVWITEIINTAIEKTMDFISLERHPGIRMIKDLAAGAVLVAAIASVLVGSIIFIPKFF